MEEEDPVLTIRVLEPRVTVPAPDKALIVAEEVSSEISSIPVTVTEEESEICPDPVKASVVPVPIVVLPVKVLALDNANVPPVVSDRDPAPSMVPSNVPPPVIVRVAADPIFTLVLALPVRDGIVLENVDRFNSPEPCRVTAEEVENAVVDPACKTPLPETVVAPV